MRLQRSDACYARARVISVSEAVMNRVLKGFIIAPIILGILMSIVNVLFGGIDFSFSGFLIVAVLYSIFAYFFTALLALPTYLIMKKLSNEKNISYLATSVCGAVIGIVVGVILMSGATHIISLSIFCVLGFGLSNIFWHIALK